MNKRNLRKPAKFLLQRRASTLFVILALFTNLTARAAFFDGLAVIKESIIRHHILNQFYLFKLLMMPSKTGPSTAGQKMPVGLRLKLANECTNILTRVKLTPSRKDQKFHLVHSKDVNEVSYNKLMVLFESLMKEMYEKSSWGWNEEEKMSEFKNSKTKILMVTRNDLSDPSNKVLEGELPADDEDIIGFMNFRFEYGAGKGECVLYVYELHIHPDHQRQGLGEELTNMGRIIGTAFKMDKIMLTVFRSNSQALQFYRKLKFITDKSSPAVNEADYMILSSKLKT